MNARALRRTLLFALLALQPGLHGAEAPAPEAPDADAPASSGSPGAGDSGAEDVDGEAESGPETAERSAAEDVFVPSIEVSEDTSVPFPVDI